MMLPVSVVVLACLCAYLLGSIPFGLLVGKLSGEGDIRRIGSGNIGATNMLRTGRKGLALATLLLDGGKGYAAVAMAALLMRALHGWPCAFCNEWGLYLPGGCAVAGHIWPVWLRFRGGKGVATTLGVFFAVSPILGITAAAAWIAVFLMTRISSLSSLVSLLLSPLLAFGLSGIPLAVLALGLAFLVAYTHRENIRRLRAGTETKWSKARDIS